MHEQAHIEQVKKQFQTKLTYGMICYWSDWQNFTPNFFTFQTKLTYGMICYLAL